MSFPGSPIPPFEGHWYVLDDYDRHDSTLWDDQIGLDGEGNAIISTERAIPPDTTYIGPIPAIPTIPGQYICFKTRCRVDYTKDATSPYDTQYHVGPGILITFSGGSVFPALGFQALNDILVIQWIENAATAAVEIEAVTGTWYELEFRCSDTGVSFYIDGVLKTSTPYAAYGLGTIQRIEPTSWQRELVDNGNGTAMLWDYFYMSGPGLPTPPAGHVGARRYTATASLGTGVFSTGSSIDFTDTEQFDELPVFTLPYSSMDRHSLVALRALGLYSNLADGLVPKGSIDLIVTSRVASLVGTWGIGLTTVRGGRTITGTGAGSAVTEGDVLLLGPDRNWPCRVQVITDPDTIEVDNPAPWSGTLQAAYVRHYRPDTQTGYRQVFNIMRLNEMVPVDFISYSSAFAAEVAESDDFIAAMFGYCSVPIEFLTAAVSPDFDGETWDMTIKGVFEMGEAV